MRISTAWMHQASVIAMTNQQALVSKTQMQLSTGERLAVPADDPGAAVNAQVMNTSLSTTQQYQSNLSTAKSRLEFEDSTLGSADNLLQQAKELAVRSLNDTLNDSDRKALGEQAQHLLDEMTGLANTKNPNGEYIFGGYKNDTPPFVFDDSRTPASYVYMGDRGQRSLQVGDQRQIADSDSGYAVFEDVASDAGDQGIGASGGRQSILNTLYSLTKALNGDFPATHGAITGSADLTQGLDYSAGPQSFDLTVDGGTTATITLPAADYPSADALAAAINTGIAGSSLQGLAVAQVRGGAIEFVSQNTGTGSSVTVRNGTPGFLADAGFSEAQTGTGAAVEFHAAASAALNGIDAGLNKVLDTRASVGARLNALDEQDNLQRKFIVDTQSSLSNIQDLDYAEAISRYTQQNAVLQASQMAYAKVQSLSLFNYL